MVYPRAHGYLTILGDGWGGQEIWQTGFRLDSPTPMIPAEFAAVDSGVMTFLGNPALKFPAGCRYIGLKWSPVGVDGKYGADGESVEWLKASPSNGGSGNAYPQIALVTSNRTARARGYASNGRNYWPSACPPLASDGLISVADAESVRANAVFLIDAINDADVGRVVVGSVAGAGRLEPVTAVRVGRVMDTQRRRRNNLAELYTSEEAVPT